MTDHVHEIRLEEPRCKVKNHKNPQTPRDRFNYDRDISGLITTLHRLNGVTEQFGYDEIGQLTSAQAFEGTGALRKLENLAYGYDAAGNLASRTNNTLIQR